MRLLKKIIKERKGMGWLRSSMLLWCAGLGLIASDFWLRLNMAGYREWRLSRLSTEGLCCVNQFDADFAMTLFGIFAGTAAICILATFAVSLLVAWLNRVSKDVGVLIAALYNFAVILLLADSLNNFEKGFPTPSPDIGTFGFVAILVAIVTGGIGILLLSLYEDTAVHDTATPETAC